MGELVTELKGVLSRTWRDKGKVVIAAYSGSTEAAAVISRSTDMKFRRWAETLRQDSRLSLRLMRQSPIFYGAAILTLALGIGANGAVFSILQSVLLQQLPYDDASRLVMLWHAKSKDVLNASTSQVLAHLGFSGEMIANVRDVAPSQLGEVAGALVMHAGSQLSAQEGDHLEPALDITVGDRALRLNGAQVTPNFFRVLGAAMGRVFAEGDDGTSGASVILSDATWRRHFGANPEILGHPITITFGMPRVTQTFTVMGVLPRGVHFTYPDEVEAWLVMPWTAFEQWNPYASSFLAIARLRPGLSASNASRLISSIPLDRPSASVDATAHQERLGLTPMHDWIIGNTRPSLYLLGGVAALLLLVTCLTVSNGLLARISERRLELAVRSALGAERSRVMQQLLVEGAFLAIGGTVVGTVLAIVIQPILRALLPGSLPQVGELRVSGSILLFGAAMAAITTMLAAVAPAWGGSRQDAAASLLRGGSGATASRSTVRWRHALIGSQAALTTMLLIFATLLLTSLWRLGRVPLGFDRNMCSLSICSCSRIGTECRVQ